MANYISSKPWEDKTLHIDNESTYLQRRKIIKYLGLTLGGLAISPPLLFSCQASPKSNRNSLQDPNNHFTFPGMEKLYPAKKNSKYKIERSLTKEYDATHYNNFYEFINPSDSSIYNTYKYIAKFDTRDWAIDVAGKVKQKGRYKLENVIKKIGLEERVYRFRCVERWTMTVPWTGFSLQKFIKMLDPSNDVTHIRMISYLNPEQMIGVKNQPWYPWPYFEGLRIDEAMNELAFMATGIFGKPLPKQNGAPVRLVVPWKYGYKNIKSIVRMEFISYEPNTFWHKIAPHEYPFISNVDPNVPHPRWSQEKEYSISGGSPRPTLKYNSYGEFVAKLYE